MLIFYPLGQTYNAITLMRRYLYLEGFTSKDGASNQIKTDNVQVLR